MAPSTLKSHNVSASEPEALAQIDIYQKPSSFSLLRPVRPMISFPACAGEKIWRMPMEDSYWEQMKSPIADMKNTGGRMGGAITAALFLREYVDTEKVYRP